MTIPENWQIKPLRYVNTSNVEVVPEDALAEAFGVYQRVDGYWQWENDFPTRLIAEDFVGVMTT